MKEKMDIRTLSEQELIDWCVGLGFKKFNGRQIYAWLWKNVVEDFDQMTNLSKKLREILKDTYIYRCIKLDFRQNSEDGTIKFRFMLQDGGLIEAVLIPVFKTNKYTVCVSSQIGCSLSCKFCATGQMKNMRNLMASEIYDQVYWVNQICEREYGAKLTNIVYMGMGEPLLNYKNMSKSVNMITSEQGMFMSPRRITISTAGIAKQIKHLADDHSKTKLAISLHAANDIKRNEIMPINESNDLKTLLDALKYYYKKTKNKISFEYIAFDGFNDTIEDAKELIKLCKHFPVTINVIEYNPVESLDFKKIKSPKNTLDQFAKILTDADIMVTVRRSRGKDIDAACGQLANKGD